MEDLVVKMKRDKEETAMMSVADSIIISDMDALCQNSIDLIRYARQLVVRQVNTVGLMTNYVLGRWIVEEQQNGQDRAQYGAHVIDRLSEALTEEFGRGYSRETLKNCRRFYLVYRDRISQTMFTEFALEKSQTVFSQLREQIPFILSWSHYLILMRIENEDERSFYEIEAYKQGWTFRTLQRQYASSLYERLLLSTDKDKVKELATQGQMITEPQDMIKDPIVLEFLGLPEKAEYSETELETRLIDHLQEFIIVTLKSYGESGNEMCQCGVGSTGDQRTQV